ncbi:uncharacterized protein PRCAT00005424001 [Priceomyces carsonii]|uniref:uncharacterized protein n=1 Tax=Priceomyces carsonii TaxID=28549 RepID=UPI002ED7F3E1|nr:unnamed protein product [Priceomyces carsonii]
MTSMKPTVKSVSTLNSVQQLKDAMGHIFQDSQISLMSHRKLVIVMKNIFKRAIDLGYHEYFGLIFTKFVNKILALKKGEQVGDRVVKFIALFVRTLNSDELERKAKEDKLDQNEEYADDDEEDSTTDLFLKYLINHLLMGIESKDKNVRFRVVQLLAYLVNQILEIDYDTYRVLYTSLSRRLNDKEPMVRIQAIISLAKFQVYDMDTEDDEEQGHEEEPLISKHQIEKMLVSAIKNDESAEVRRASLINLTRTKENIPFLLERARDSNSINRRLVYSRIMKELGDFRRLDFHFRESLLKWGLNDRDVSVQKAAVRMLTEDWFNTVEGDLLKLISELHPTESESASDAMISFFDAKPEKIGDVKINEIDWNNLVPEEAFLLSTFYSYCNRNNIYDAIEANFPESVDLSETLRKQLELRTSFLRNNVDTLAKHDAFKQAVQEIENEAFPLQTEMFKVKYEMDHNFRNFQKAESTLENLNYQITLYKKRIKDLSSGIEVRQTLKKGSDRELTEEEFFLSLAPRDLRSYIKENEEDIKSLNDSIENFETNIFRSQQRFTELEEKFAIISNKRDAEMSRFNSKNKEYLPFKSELKNIEFIVEQLLLIAKDYDFSDEIGRRKMLQVIRISLMDDNLNDRLTELTLKVLRKISISERDFTTMCTEIINDLRDSFDNEDDSFHSAISGFDNDEQPDEFIDSNTSKKRKVDVAPPPNEVIVQCLIIAQHALELAEEPLEHNLSLSSLRFSLINFAIQQMDNVTIYTLGLKCLGLFTLLDRDSVFDSIQLFNLKLRDGTEEVRVIAVKAMVDILSTYGPSVIKEKMLIYSLARNFHKNLNQFDMPKLQCIVAEGVCKLFLADIFSDSLRSDDEGFESTKQLFESLILSYFHPLTAKNPELRQILAFCIPVYAFSHVNHQVRLGTITGDCVFRMFLEDGDFMRYENKLAPNTLIQQLINWCDPRNLVNVPLEEVHSLPSHVLQAISLLQAVEQETPKNVKKAIINNLSKFAIYEELSSKVLEGLLTSLTDTKSCFEANTNNSEFNLDKTTIRNFNNFHDNVRSCYEKSVARELKEASEKGSRSVSANASSTSLLNVKDKASETNDVDMASEREAALNDVPGSATDRETSFTDKNQSSSVSANSSQQNIDNTLRNIDKMLAEEDDVEYDISMSD